MRNLPEGMIADHHNQVYYDTELGQFYIIKWEEGYYDIPTRYYIPVDMGSTLEIFDNSVK
jgi:hypothetical protein